MVQTETVRPGVNPPSGLLGLYGLDDWSTRGRVIKIIVNGTDGDSQTMCDPPSDRLGLYGLDDWSTRGRVIKIIVNGTDGDRQTSISK